MTFVAIVYVSPSLKYYGNVFTEGKIPFLSKCHDERESSFLANIACVLIGINFLPFCFMTFEFFLISQLGTAYWHSLWQVSRAVHTYANMNVHPLPLRQMNYWSLETQFKNHQKKASLTFESGGVMHVSSAFPLGSSSPSVTAFTT